ncbi:MAG: site-2 protease family protein [Microthrixaceae bacterium]|nr:site-2 protease family protein [Microthrixaceae bacterium]
MGSRPLFRIFGIPVTVEPWFFLGLFIFYSLSGGGRGGLYTAVGIGLFVLVHELGHALVARRFGAEVSISLNFLVGWASYSSQRELARWQRNLISLAGPLVQISAAALALWVLRVTMLPLADRAAADLFADIESAIMWAGVILGGLNLLPLWPLDGGHVVESFLRGRLGLGGTTLFLRWTLAASILMVVMGATNSGRASSGVEQWALDWRIDALVDPVPLAVGKVLATVPVIAATSTVFIGIFTGLGAWQALQALRMVTGPARDQGIDHSSIANEPQLRRVRTAERHGWTLGEPGEFPRGWRASPWLDAHLARHHGGSPQEISSALQRLGDPKRNWVVDDVSRPALGELLAFVPPELSTSPAVIEARVYHGGAEDLVAAALAAHRGRDEAEAFYLIAEGMAQRGLHDDAMSWLTAAVERRPDPRRVSTARELSVLHGRSDYQQLRGVAERAVNG